jgi:hypothetical protein
MGSWPGDKRRPYPPFDIRERTRKIASNCMIQGSAMQAGERLFIFA